MSKKITELPAAASVAPTDVVPIVDLASGTTKKATISQIGATPGGGTVTLEHFDPRAGTGDATIDQDALEEAAAALNAGEYHTLVLGAPEDGYTFEGVDLTRAGIGIVGQGPHATIIHTTSNRAVFQFFNTTERAADGPTYGFYAAGFSVIGNETGTLQRAIANGQSGGDGTSDLNVAFVHAEDLGGAGFVHSAQPRIIGAAFTQCVARNCGRGWGGAGGGGFLMTSQATLSNCRAEGNTLGLGQWAGNVTWNGGDIIENDLGIEVSPGGNDGHCIVNGTNVNHNTKHISIGAIVNGTTLADCHFYDGEFEVVGNSGCVNVRGCTLDCTVYDLRGKVSFSGGCKVATAYFASYGEDANSEVDWGDTRHIDGTLPSWIGERLQVAYSFASDANASLSKQQSAARSLVVYDGATTAERTLTSTRAPAVGERIRLANRNSFPVAFQFSSGTSVSVPSAKTADIVGDGTNAFIEMMGDNSGVAGAAAFSPADLSLTMYLSDYAGSPWEGQASAGTSGSNDGSASNPPTVGTLDGHGIATFDGFNDVVTMTGTLETYVNAGSFFVAALVRGTTLGADPGPGSRQSARGIVSDGGGGYWGVTMTTTGPCVFVYDGTYKDQKATTTDPTGNWMVVFAWGDGTNIYVQANNGTPANAACGTIDNLTNVVAVGNSYGGSLWTGDMAALLVSDDHTLSGDIADIYAWFKAEYPTAGLP